MIEWLVSGKVFGRLEQPVDGGSGKPLMTGEVRAANTGSEMTFPNALAFDNIYQAVVLALVGRCSAVFGTAHAQALDGQGSKAARPLLQALLGVRSI